MDKPTRSPLLGYNHNVRYGGRILHVQTEDSGPANPHLFTHLFFEGSILGTKRCQYDAAIPENEVRGLMQGQHKEILKELKQGLYDDRLGEFFASRGEVFTAPSQAEPAPAPTPQPGPDEDEVLITHEDVGEPPAPLAQAIPDATPSPGPEILDLDSIPTPPPEKMRTPEPLPLHIIRPAMPGPGTYTFKRATRDIATMGARETGASSDGRRKAATPASPVVVQRRVVVGVGGKNTGTPRPIAPRPRRPGGGIPYVVQEGSHPNIAAATQPAAGVPPASPIADSFEAAESPRTAAPAPAEPLPAESLVSTRSLDDVILAYLSKGEQPK